MSRGRAARGLVVAWNALGTRLLAVSFPLFHAYGTRPEHLNTWVAYFPFVWLPAVLVSAALLGHVVLWRRLLTEVRTAPPTKHGQHMLNEI